MADKLQEFGIVHQSTKLPWLILAMSIFSPMSIAVNSYQAEGGSDLKTYFVGYACTVCMYLGLAFWWVIFIPLILSICIWAFGIFHGKTVMDISK